MKYQPGQSGNPGGRPKAVLEVVRLAREQTEPAMRRLALLVDDKDGRVAIAAINSLMDRAWGKPAQPIVGDDDADPIRVAPDFSRLNPEQRAALRDLITKATGS